MTRIEKEQLEKAASTQNMKPGKKKSRIFRLVLAVSILSFPLWIFPALRLALVIATYRPNPWRTPLSEKVIEWCRVNEEKILDEVAELISSNMDRDAGGALNVPETFRLMDVPGMRYEYCSIVAISSKNHPRAVAISVGTHAKPSILVVLPRGDVLRDIPGVQWISPNIGFIENQVDMLDSFNFGWRNDSIKPVADSP